MKDLIDILNEFGKERDKKLKENDGILSYEDIAKCFAPCAENILLKGFFLVNGKYIIDLGCIELYYHEEEGDIKDPIMYHTNDRGSCSQFANESFPYFKLGSFNLHQSGVDVTFENEEKKYRASFLIRAYRVLKDESELSNDNKYDGRSSFIFDDMFPKGVFFGDNGFKIEWKKCKTKEGQIERCNRRNVPEYEKEKSKEKKNPGEIKYNVVNSKEDRKWGFKRSGIRIVYGSFLPPKK